MKKFFFAIGLMAGLGVSSLFANVELGLNLYGTPYSGIKIEDTDHDIESTAQLKDPFGFETQFEFFFGAPAKFVDVGMGLSWGMDFFNKMELFYDGKSLGSNTFGFAFDSYMTLGPAVRFHVGDMNSFLVSPGLICNFVYGAGRHPRLVGFYSGFNLDLGYRLWVVNKTGFHFGFDVGADLNFPFAGFSRTRFSTSAVEIDGAYDIKGGTDAKIYFGIVFNFGDKAPDKARNRAE